MPQSYDDAAEAVKENNVVEPWEVDKQEVQAEITEFMHLDNPNKQGAKQLTEEVSDRMMNQVVQASDGQFFSKRKDVTVYKDTHGNVMAQRKGQSNVPGGRTKLIDSSEAPERL